MTQDTAPETIRLFLLPNQSALLIVPAHLVGQCAITTVNGFPMGKVVAQVCERRNLVGLLLDQDPGQLPSQATQLDILEFDDPKAPEMLFQIEMLAMAIDQHLAVALNPGDEDRQLGFPNTMFQLGEPSVGSVGDSHDHALAETINGRIRAEVIHRCGPWRSFEAVEYATLEWVDWFNNRRLLEPIRNIPPAEAEASSYAALESEPVAAQPTKISVRQTQRGSSPCDPQTAGDKAACPWSCSDAWFRLCCL